ncbi:hypothetical protein LCGC14_2151540, partial [marine sediment metagenome]
WEKDVWGRNFLGTPPQGRADYAFFQHILNSMDPETGRCAILFPHGVLFRNEEAEMRRKLIKADLGECVLGLGPGLFYNSPMEACVILCRSKKPADRQGRILFIDAVAEIARDPDTHGLPISGIGGITTWRDAAEFLALGSGSVQVCTAAMTYGFKIIDELTAGLSRWMDEKGYASVAEVSGRAVPNVTDWQYLNLNYVTKARIDQEACIKCGRCYAACEDTSHQAIAIQPGRVFEVIDAECVACNLCVDVCPVEDCITMERLAAGETDPRTGRVVQSDYANWTTHANNPSATAAE